MRLFLALMLLPTLAFCFESTSGGRYHLLNSSNDEVFMVDTVSGRAWIYSKSSKQPIWVPTLFQCENETSADNPDCDGNRKLNSETKTK